eukprot:326523_1
MDIIIKSFQKFTNMEIISFLCSNTDTQNIVSYIEMGLLNSKRIIRKSLTVSVRIMGHRNITMREIECYIARIMNALDASNINDVMLIFSMRNNSRWNASKYMNKIVKHFEQTHLAVISTNDNVKIIISNKNCKINGYDTGLGIL